MPRTLTYKSPAVIFLLVCIKTHPVCATVEAGCDLGVRERAENEILTACLRVDPHTHHSATPVVRLNMSRYSGGGNALCSRRAGQESESRGHACGENKCCFQCVTSCFAIHRYAVSFCCIFMWHRDGLSHSDNLVMCRNCILQIVRKLKMQKFLGNLVDKSLGS